MSPDDGRDETGQERLDRLWSDVLQELRVMQTGVQLLAAFLLTLPFQPSFGDLDAVQEAMYLGLLLTAAATTLAVVAPVAVHRHLSGRHVKERVVAVGKAALLAAVTGVALLVVVMVTFIVDVVVGRGLALGVGAGFLALAVALLAVLPRRLAREE